MIKNKNIPQLRFPEFEGEWEEKKIDDVIYNIKSGKTNANEFGEYKVYGSTEIIGYNDSYNYEGEYLLIARVGANAGTVNKSNGKFSITDNTLIIDSDKNTINTDFLYYTLIGINLTRFIFGSGQPLVTSKLIKNIHLNLPPRTN